MTEPPTTRPHSSEASLHRFCPFCGTPLLRSLIGDRERPRCPQCGYVHWRNPAVGVAAILRETAIVSLLGEDRVRAGLNDPAWTPAPELGRILLIRRATSFSGMWCLPCGYVEYDEEIREALGREIREETGLQVGTTRLVAVLSNFHEPDRQSVGVWFDALPLGGTLRPGDDAAALGFFAPDSIAVPLAFPTDLVVLRALGES
jgi:8-oxo-dGTP diphosphatase